MATRRHFIISSVEGVGAVAGIAGVATDPSTGLAADARLTETLAPGSYIVALTEFDNFSIAI